MNLLNAFYDGISRLIDRKMAADKTGFVKAKIPAAYVSGNPTSQLPGETASTAGSKTEKIVQPYGFGLSGPAASDEKAVLKDNAGNRVTLGKLVDLASSVTDAQGWGSVRWVQPGGTTFHSANTERSTASTTYVTQKSFLVSRPGKYRIGMELASDIATNGAARAQVVIAFDDSGDIVASAEALSNSAHTTFTVAALDMTVAVPMGAVIKVQLKDNTGSNTAYIKNVTLQGADATTAQSVYSAVLID